MRDAVNSDMGGRTGGIGAGWLFSPRLSALHLALSLTVGPPVWQKAERDFARRRTRMTDHAKAKSIANGSVEAVRDLSRRVFNEDRVLVEFQRPKDLPLDGDDVHIAADRTSIAYRRLLKQMGLSLTYAGVEEPG